MSSPADTSLCQAPREPAVSVRQYRNVYLFYNAAFFFAVAEILASLVGKIDWTGVLIGCGLLASTWAFCSVVNANGENPRRRAIEYVALLVGVQITVLSVFIVGFGDYLFLMLIMPAAYFCWIRPTTVRRVWRSLRSFSRVSPTG